MIILYGIIHTNNIITVLILILYTNSYMLSIISLMPYIGYIECVFAYVSKLFIPSGLGSSYSFMYVLFQLPSIQSYFPVRSNPHDTKFFPKNCNPKANNVGKTQPRIQPKNIHYRTKIVEYLKSLILTTERLYPRTMLKGNQNSL